MFIKVDIFVQLIRVDEETRRNLFINKIVKQCNSIHNHHDNLKTHSDRAVIRRKCNKKVHGKQLDV